MINPFEDDLSQISDNEIGAYLDDLKKAVKISPKASPQVQLSQMIEAIEILEAEMLQRQSNNL